MRFSKYILPLRKVRSYCAIVKKAELLVPGHAFTFSCFNEKVYSDYICSLSVASKDPYLATKLIKEVVHIPICF